MLEMVTEKEENPKPEQTDPPESVPAGEELPNELRAALWSVVSFDKCEARGLTYPEAEQKISELEAAKVSGLCIVTDETAARISAQKT